jgi:hypothetical protein
MINRYANGECTLPMKRVTMGAFDPNAIGEVEFPFSLEEYRARLGRVRAKMA